ncbi:hypothetical protein NUH87_26860 [Pseudomonas batumici]|uniref:glycine-rich domain-containing protein n=1 Tax=Pseudomonas batumici TaxID=226910 RepID=UPI0030D42FE0
MYQIDNSTAAPLLPASTAPGTAGFFTDGNPATGTTPTILPAEFLNMLMLEILGVLSAAGVTPSKSNFTQLVTAIKAVNKQATILADTGIAGAYSAVNVPALTALPGTGFVQRVNIANANTGASTYAPDGLAAKPIYGMALQPLQGGELPPGIAVMMYLVQAGVNGGNGAWVLIESLGGAAQVAQASKSQHAPTVAQMQAGYGTYALDTGAANAIVAALSPAPTSLTDTMPIRVAIAANNTGPTTLNLNGLGVKPVVGLGSAALQGNELVAGGRATFMWAAAQNSWILLSCQAAAMQIGAASQSQHAMQMGQAVGRLLNVKNFTTPGTSTYTPTAGTNSIVVEVVGGGGGSGGCQATTSSQLAVSGGGSGAGCARSYYTSGFSGLTITVGSGGVAGSSGTGFVGGNGTASSLGSLLSSSGGIGGAAGIALANTANATSGNNVAGAATGGTLLNSSGLNAAPSVQLGTYLAAGAGGADGCGGQSGATGVINTSSQPTLSGVAGKNGRVTIYEYA